MKSSATSIGASALASQYNNLRQDAFGGSFLLPHEQATPDLTLRVENGVVYVGNTRVLFAGGNSPSFTAPTTNPRIDLLTIDSAGTLARVAGTEAASPSVPAYPADKIVIAEVYNRISQTAIYDTDQGSHGYIKQDVRPILGGSYISSDAQVDAAAAIQISKIRKNSDVLPETDNTYKLGNSTFQWSEVRAKKVFKDNSEIGGKFGGDGADGALSISIGTTTLDVGAAKVFIKNYTSISITGTGMLAFSNPHPDGTIIILKSQGAVTITSTGSPAIDLRSMGGIGGSPYADGNSGTGIIFDYGKGAQGAIGTGTAGGTGGVKGQGYRTLKLNISKNIFVTCGSGGGSGGADSSGSNSTAGTGGRGAGALIIECGGAYNRTGSIDASGANGTAATNATGNTGGGKGGGAGGGGGSVLVLYATLTADSGTTTLTGGNGGAGGNSDASVTVSGGGGGAGGAGHYHGGAGGVGSRGTGGTGGTGATGGSSDGNGGGGASGAGGGGAGAGGAGYYESVKNTEFS